MTYEYRTTAAFCHYRCVDDKHCSRADLVDAGSDPDAANREQWIWSAVTVTGLLQQKTWSMVISCESDIARVFKLTNSVSESVQRQIDMPWTPDWDHAPGLVTGQSTVM